MKPSGSFQPCLTQVLAVQIAGRGGLDVDLAEPVVDGVSCGGAHVLTRRDVRA